MLIAVTTLLASLGGYLLAGLNEEKRDRRTAAQDRERRADEALLRREEERHRAQLETLMALQQDVQKVAREAGRTMHFDLMQAREGKYTQLPGGWSEDDLAARQSLSLHHSRVLDEEVRRAVEEFSAVAAAVSTTPAALMGLAGEELEAASTRQMVRLLEAAQAAQSAVGAAVRHELQWEPAVVG